MRKIYYGDSKIQGKGIFAIRDIKKGENVFIMRGKMHKLNLETKEKAMEDNKKKAIESGNVLSQTINAEGNLVSVANINTTEKNLLDSASISDIRKELFEGENIVIDKNSDHGMSKIFEIRPELKEEYEANTSSTTTTKDSIESITEAASS